MPGAGAVRETHFPLPPYGDRGSLDTEGPRFSPERGNREDPGVTHTLVGSLAPDFDMPCTPRPGTGRQRACLADFRGRWLALVFYPRDFSLVCPTELVALSEYASEFRRGGCELLAVSCDP